MKNQQRFAAWACAATLVGLGLAGCGKGSDSVTVEGDVPLAYVKRSTALAQNPTDGMPSAPGGDLMVREKSSPSAPEYNVTARFTQDVGDVSDPEASYDGKKIVFAMKCPTTNTATTGNPAVPACTGRWNIWEYDMSAGAMDKGSFRRITASTTANDADPAYLPAGGGFVFSSDRQTTSKTKQKEMLGETGEYFALDEYERERVMNLHTMDADGGNIKQISVNQSHDRNPVVNMKGEIMFSRWEHVGPKNRFAIFTVKPDGTNMFVRYGALSPGNSFLHPREMDPSGAYKGFLASSLMALSRTHEGGSLMFIDAEKYSEDGVPADSSVSANGGQREVTQNALNQNGGLSEFGRMTSPYPLWDGTNRVLVGYRPCAVTVNGAVTLCANLSATQKASLSMDDQTDAQIDANPVKDNAPADYAIWMFDPAKQTLAIVAAPPSGYMFTDPIALQARVEPAILAPAELDTDSAARAARGMALIEVRSVYDTDGLGRMGESMLVDSDKLGCTQGIALTTPPAALKDTRAQVADLVKMKDPADAAYGCAPARFVRAIRAVAPPSSGMGLRSAIGETEFEQQQILGYAPIEPDGSFKLEVPADTPIGLAVVDAKGRGIQTHLNWIQVRPGEKRTCDGCHSPRRGGALNSGDIADTKPASWKAALAAVPGQKLTMASRRAALDATVLNLKTDMVFTDEWADTAAGGVARPSISMKYVGNTNPADDLATAVPTRGLINYPTHIQPLWTRVRGTAGANTCTGCHSDSAKLDLRATTSGSGRVTSYEELLIGDPVLDANGKPKIELREGVPMIVRGPALVETMAGNATGMARGSRLAEIMFGETLKAGTEARTAHPAPPGTAPDHSTLLNLAEKRLIAEWMDVGGQYYNNPFDGGVARTASTLSEATFVSQIQPILRATCASSCHQAIGGDATAPIGTSFARNRFVLTGSADGDFGVTLSMISDTCRATSNYLLTKPSSIPHPAGATRTTAVLQAGSADYIKIRDWIAAGCTGS